MKLRHPVGLIESTTARKSGFSKSQQLGFYNIIHVSSPDAVSGYRAGIFSRIARKEEIYVAMRRARRRSMSNCVHFGKNVIRHPGTRNYRRRAIKRTSHILPGVNRDPTVGRDAASVRQPLPTQDANVISGLRCGAARCARTTNSRDTECGTGSGVQVDSRANAREVSSESNTVDSRKFSINYHKFASVRS